MIRNAKKTLGSVRVALVAGVGIPLLMSVSAYAQEPAAAPAAGGEASTERVIVTGSYIPTAEEVTASPLDTLTTQEIRRAGTSDVLTVLQKRNPDFVGAGNIGSTNANISSGATLGGSVVSLRGLPTLVLYQGRRIVDSAAIAVGGAQFSDVNLFPTALISRIEVLKDGASALYGSEAVGGVVNIFMKQEFTGVEIGARYGFSVEPGVAERRAYAIAGLGNDTTHVTVGFQYLEMDPLFLRERAYSRVPGGLTTTYAGVGREAARPGLSPSGFSLLQPGLNSPFDLAGVVPGAIPAGGLKFLNPALQGAYAPASQAEVNAFDLSTKPTSTLDVSNTNAYASFTHQIFGKQLELFGDFLFSKNHSENFLNAQPLSNATGVVIPAGRVGTINNVNDPNYIPGVTNTIFNPFAIQLDNLTLSGAGRLTAGQRYQSNPRTFTTDSTFYRWLAGLRSQFAKDWTAEAAAYYSNYSIDFVNGGLVNATQLNKMIAGTAVDLTGNSIPAFDFFSRDPVGTGPGQVSAGQFATIFGNNIRKLGSYQEVFDARITGFPFQLPGGAVGLSLGGEYRQEGFKVQDSPEIFVGSVPIQEINASRFIYSFYGELSIPIVGPQMNVPLIHSLELNLAGRFDHYDGVDEDAKVPKVTLRYQPIKDLTLRATYSNSFVAPTLYQLFGPASQGFSDTVDLFNPESGEFETQDQAQVRSGSNPNLLPSKAESYTAGMVYSPSYVPGLVISADYFRTWQKDIVGVLGGSKILNSVNELGPNSPFANLVSFNAFPGSQGAQPVTAPFQLVNNLAAVFYLDTNLNLGIARIEGFDLSARYNIDFQRYGQLELGINAVVFTKYDLKTDAFSDYFNILGLNFTEFSGGNGGGANPDYKLTFLAEYRFMGFTLSANANYIPEMLNAVGSDPETVDQNTLATIDDYFSVDARLSYTFVRKAAEAAAAGYSKDGKNMVADSKAVAGAATLSPVDRILDGLTLTVGCNNVFDETPPFVEGANSATNLSIYDPYGQFVYFEVSKKF